MIDGDRPLVLGVGSHAMTSMIRGPITSLIAGVIAIPMGRLGHQVHLDDLPEPGQARMASPQQVLDAPEQVADRDLHLLQPWMGEHAEERLLHGILRHGRGGMPAGEGVEAIVIPLDQVLHDVGAASPPRFLRCIQDKPPFAAPLEPSR